MLGARKSGPKTGRPISLRRLRIHRLFQGELQLEDVVTGQRSNWVREAVDANYEVSLPSRVRRSQSAREPRKVPEGACAKRECTGSCYILYQQRM